MLAACNMPTDCSTLGSMMYSAVADCITMQLIVFELHGAGYGRQLTCRMRCSSCQLVAGSHVYSCRSSTVKLSILRQTLTSIIGKTSSQASPPTKIWGDMSPCPLRTLCRECRPCELLYVCSIIQQRASIMYALLHGQSLVLIGPHSYQRESLQSADSYLLYTILRRIAISMGLLV